MLSIAYNKPYPAVDGNVMRVISRILSIWDDIAKPKTRNIFEFAVDQLISREKPSEFNQGLMELGALICTPTSPACLICPVNMHCSALEEGVQHELPVKSKRKSRLRNQWQQWCYLMMQATSIFISVQVQVCLRIYGSSQTWKQ